MLYLSPDTTAVLVADRRKAREAAARRRSRLRRVAHDLRRALPTRAPAPSPGPVPAGRTPARAA